MAEECTQRHQCCQFPMGESFDVTYQYKAYVAHFAHFWCSSCSRMLSTEGCTNYLWNIGFWRGRKQPRTACAGVLWFSCSMSPFCDGFRCQYEAPSTL